ncbi:cysteine desulfurase NifS [Paenibacillus odorifer]|uniref:cysteine desulfurase n=1 Tax=Paenibacillus odorifer TaxID=189426 RepID=A0A1R0ZH70_9BACL|nr:MULTISPECIES: cysteine desulfurase family protein [Paenibacillus]AIQ25614.1 cysteine desulfurase [Paenibacillus sp. FSL H7-0737]OMD50613.1 cysteine desulfurase NifS [Paenibacillus odorifer]OME70021.1 cysteine desulfurase NifS [Paenibacillus odorifer]
MKSIYLDHAASTPVHPEVAKVMLNIMTEQYGNASSVHQFGRSAKRILNGARDNIAAFLGCSPDEWVFTGGGTESDNLALYGAAAAVSHKGKHIITTQIEHHAVLHTCEELEKEGFKVTYLPVDSTGRVSVTDVEAALQEDTVLISVMYANNEVGTVQPIQEIGQLARERGILFHVDAVQALGALPITLRELPVDYMSFTAHKINGPQGIGGLYVRSGAPLHPRLHGGLQERGRRAGTENLAGAAGFAKAVEIAVKGLSERQQNMKLLRSRLLEELDTLIGRERYSLNGNTEEFLPSILNLSFPGAGTDVMLMNLDMEGIAAASGSACTSGSLEISHVLKAMGLPQNILESAIRFSIGLGNTTEEIEYVARKVETILNRLRK